MLALQLQNPGIMGLSAEGQQVVASTTAAVAERVQRIRSKLISVGIPAAFIGGGVTTLVFAGAFGLARSERVWAPAIWLGAISTVGSLIATAIAAKAVNDVATQQAQTAAPQGAVPAVPAATATAIDVQKAAFFY